MHVESSLSLFFGMANIETKWGGGEQFFDIQYEITAGVFNCRNIIFNAVSNIVEILATTGGKGFSGNWSTNQSKFGFNIEWDTGLGVCASLLSGLISRGSWICNL